MQNRRAWRPWRAACIRRRQGMPVPRAVRIHRGRGLPVPRAACIRRGRGLPVPRAACPARLARAAFSSAKGALGGRKGRIYNTFLTAFFCKKVF